MWSLQKCKRLLRVCLWDKTAKVGEGVFLWRNDGAQVLRTSARSGNQRVPAIPMHFPSLLGVGNFWCGNSLPLRRGCRRSETRDDRSCGKIWSQCHLRSDRLPTFRTRLLRTTVADHGSAPSPTKPRNAFALQIRWGGTFHTRNNAAVEGAFKLPEQSQAPIYKRTWCRRALVSRTRHRILLAGFTTLHMWTRATGRLWSPVCCMDSCKLIEELLRVTLRHGRTMFSGIDAPNANHVAFTCGEAAWPFGYPT